MKLFYKSPYKFPKEIIFFLVVGLLAFILVGFTYKIRGSLLMLVSYYMIFSISTRYTVLYEEKIVLFKPLNFFYRKEFINYGDCISISRKENSHKLVIKYNKENDVREVYINVNRDNIKEILSFISVRNSKIQIDSKI